MTQHTQSGGRTDGSATRDLESLVVRPGVAAVLTDDCAQLLLHRRRTGEGWAPLSGAVEPGEDVVTALHREIYEETALDVDVTRLVGVYSDPRHQIIRYRNGPTVHFVTCVFLCTRIGGRLKGSDEGLEWDWFPQDAMPDGMTPYGALWIQDAVATSGAPFIR